MNFYNTYYPEQVLFRGVKTSGVFPNSVRFLIQPKFTAKYVYIGDIDIFLLDTSIIEWHTSFMRKYHSDFSNVMRNNNQLTGLHFMEYEKMYPVKIPVDVDLARMNDEVLLCRLMREKHCIFPPLGIPLSERKIHGLHISLFNRPPLPTLTTNDRLADYPSWGIEPEYSGVERYFDVRYSEPVMKFTECIRDNQVKLRQVIQFTDMFAYYVFTHGQNASAAPHS